MWTGTGSVPPLHIETGDLEEVAQRPFVTRSEIPGQVGGGVDCVLLAGRWCFSVSEKRPRAEPEGERKAGPRPPPPLPPSWEKECP